MLGHYESSMVDRRRVELNMMSRRWSSMSLALSNFTLGRAHHSNFSFLSHRERHSLTLLYDSIFWISYLFLHTCFVAHCEGTSTPELRFDFSSL